MILFSPTVLYPPVATNDHLKSFDIVFGVWASLALIASVALGVAPVLDPEINGHLKSFDIVFGVWASLALIALAMLSVALGVAPVVDPEICFGC
jgi:cyanate permease